MTMMESMLGGAAGGLVAPSDLVPVTSTLELDAEALALAGDDLVELRDLMLRKLRRQRADALYFYAWYRGQQTPPDMPPAADYKPAFHRLRRMARGAWARLVVDAIAERLAIQGVQTSGGEAADEAAWALLVANRLDADQRDVYTEAFVTGLSYVSVGDDGQGGARITPETCLEVTHLAASGDRRVVDAALKIVDLGRSGWQCDVYTEQVVATWFASYRDPQRTPLQERSAPPWTGPLIVQNDLGVVPYVPFENRPTVAMPSLSELDELLPIMERLQELELAKLIGVYTVTFPQKYATGLVVDRDPTTGQPLASFETGPMRLWVSPSPDTRFGSFAAGDIHQYLEAIGASIGELAAISRVPAYYFVQSKLSNPPSAESLVQSETGLVSKCLDRQRSFGESWESVVRIGSQITGASDVADDDGLAVVWHTPERRNPAIVADAAVKIASPGVNVPQEEVWRFLGYSPEQIQRMNVQAATQALLEPPAAPPPAPISASASA